MALPPAGSTSTSLYLPGTALGPSEVKTKRAVGFILATAAACTHHYVLPLRELTWLMHARPPIMVCVLNDKFF